MMLLPERRINEKYTFILSQCAVCALLSGRFLFMVMVLACIANHRRRGEREKKTEDDKNHLTNKNM